MSLRETLSIKLQNQKSVVKLRNMTKKQKAKTVKNTQDAESTKSTTKLTWLPKKTFELEFTIPWKRAKESYDRVLKEVAKRTTLKGFRPGKAPISLVEKNADKGKFYEEVIRSLLPETYQLAVQKHNLAPVVSPKIEPLSVKENEDWKFKATACEKPEIKLGNYQALIKGELAKDKIWTPARQSTLSGTRLNKPTWSIKGGGGPGKPDKKEAAKPSAEEKMKTVTRVLVENIKAEISDILLGNEANRMLSQLLDQVNSLGMTVQQYLSSKNLTHQQQREKFRKQAEATLKLEFILQEIVRERKIKVTPEEIEKMIKAIPDEKIRENFNRPQEKAYVALLLAKRKAIDYLISL